MRVLAIDLGDKRTGLAAGDDETGVVSALRVIDVPLGDDLVAAVVRAIDEHDPDAIVVGLPLNMDDSEGAQAKRESRVRSQGFGVRCPCFCEDGSSGAPKLMTLGFRRPEAV